MIEELLKRIEALEKQLLDLKDYSNVPMENQSALEGLGFVRVPFGSEGVVLSDGVSSRRGPFLSGTSTVYVASVNGGGTTQGITFIDGIRQT